MVALRIALRYLFARKTHAAVNVITLISMAGIAVAAMAMVCVLSVFNGFRDLAETRLSAVDPDIKITRTDGTVMADGDSVVRAIERVPGIQIARQMLEQQALAVSDGDQLPVRVRGVEDEYGRVSGLRDILLDGEFDDEPMVYALLSVGVAVRTGARPSPETPFILTAPRRLGRINPAFPMAAFRRDTLIVSGVYQSNQTEYDDDLVYVPISVARDLFDYTTEATSVDVAVTPGCYPAEVAETIQHELGPDYLVADRLMQQRESFRMIQVEKWITFLMLVFVLIMASFNILSTMSMLIIEKEGDLGILSAMGATKGMIRGIFRWEGMLVAWAGGAVGILAGWALSLAQQHYELISLGGDTSSMSITAYPCRPDVTDLMLTVAVVTAIGVLSGLISARKVGVR
ncbi:MAG: ABC transporter permease [Duncaniella sp.]|nr:ABC transporter permease [Duncaniella sp.]